MNTPSHTPGPWVLQLLDERHHGYDWPTFCIRSSGGNNCLAVVGDVDRATAENNTANALLIASAPALLEELEGCVGVLQSIDNQLKGKSFAVTDMLRRSRAALAKAKGTTP